MKNITSENCKGCPIYEDDKYKINMVVFNICPKRDNVGCPRGE